ncbi:uncharacterized protein LOC115330777 [Ixodes scapularis]|uniref:uncharacterized protein LOC115330777 n=1 Tax=Ixodes scapularis TaxID=6945 RepID=UPI001C393181|nr:uncharacterized protein LOC115330777 [Ixodes scapularis]
MCLSRPQLPCVGPSGFQPGPFLRAALFISRLYLLRLRLRSFGLYLRKTIPHPAVHQVFGFNSASWTANYRVMQIARSELSQEILVMQRSLPGLMTGIFGARFTVHPSYIFLTKSGQDLLDSSWKVVIATASTEKRANQCPKLQPPLNLSGSKLSPQAEALLSKGPKFAPPVTPSRVDQLAAVHQIASRIPEPARQEFLGVGSRLVCMHGAAHPTKPEFPQVVNELRGSDLRHLEADKTGVFVVMNESNFGEKVELAIKKNFVLVNKRPSGTLRSEVKDICRSNNLSSLLTRVSAPANQYLKVFFTAKTHKPEIPLRSIVSENGCWQKPLALYLQKHLAAVPLDQPFRVGSSQELLPALQLLHTSGPGTTFFSLDITDMYYSLDFNILLDAVEKAITTQGIVKFQNSSGIPLSAFLQLIRVYLRSTMVEHDGKIYLQKSGVCIGSCLAPSLSEVYLSFVDQAVKEQLDSVAPGTQVFRYVDDYLVLHDSGAPTAAIQKAFTDNANGLSFTREDPSAEGLQFLDLRLVATQGGTCWRFQQRTQKPVLPFTSHHSKTVKAGIAKSLISSTRRKSCQHLSSSSLEGQLSRLSRLTNAGYPRDLLASTLRKLIVEKTAARKPARQRYTTIPYFHNTAHRLKTVARRFDMDVAFSCPFKLSAMCRLVNTPPPPKISCAKRHAAPFVPCAVGRVYSVPFSCGAEYIGQTGRCLNDRLREHEREIEKNDEDSQHPMVHHLKVCAPCAPEFPPARVLGANKNRYGREIVEAFAIKEAPKNISSASLSLSEREVTFLRPELTALAGRASAPCS